MWVVVYLVKGNEALNSMRQLLESHKILVMTRKKTSDNDSDAFYDVLVPQAEVETAQELIIMNEPDKMC